MIRDYSVIGGETLTIRRTNPRTPGFIYMLVVFGIGFPAMYFVTPAMRSFPWFFFVAMLLVITLNLRVWGLLTTITIGPEGVRFKSPLKERLYPWAEIKGAGMYVRNGRSFRVLNRNKFDETFYVRMKYVWFSLRDWIQPSVFTFPGETYCDFEFNKDAWELFNKYLVGNPDPNKLPGFDRYVMGESQRNHWMH